MNMTFAVCTNLPFCKNHKLQIVECLCEKNHKMFESVEEGTNDDDLEDLN